MARFRVTRQKGTVDDLIVATTVLGWMGVVVQLVLAGVLSAQENASTGNTQARQLSLAKTTQTPPEATMPARPSLGTEPFRCDAAALSAAIDGHLQVDWKRNGVQPAEPADDAEFLRRAYLDLAGKIPPAAVVRDFLADPAADKRQRMIERLLDGPAYVARFTHVWRDVLLPETRTDQNLQFMVLEFDAWLRKQLGTNAPYNAMVRELLTVELDPVASDDQALYQYYSQQKEPRPAAFYAAKRAKPENLAGSTARVFLGQRVECAQCHDHPSEPWTREAFWGYAAFFSPLRNDDRATFTGTLAYLFGGRSMRQQPLSIAIPETDRIVPAALLDGSRPAVNRQNARQELADWVLAPENPYFARAAVNRMWSWLMGTGLVEPIDDMAASNPPSHPAILDDLAREFVAHDYDLKFILASIAGSRAYQVTSRVSHESQKDPHRFARMQPRGLSARQLMNSLIEALGDRPVDAVEEYAGYGGSGFNSPYAAQLMAVFDSSTQSLTARRTSIVQALAMMNGQYVGEATAGRKEGLLPAVTEMPGLSTAEQIEILYLSTLSRLPRPEETARLVKYVDAANKKKKPNSRAALGDVFWALLNSSEFLLNH